MCTSPRPARPHPSAGSPSSEYCVAPSSCQISCDVTFVRHFLLASVSGPERWFAQTKQADIAMYAFALFCLSQAICLLVTRAIKAVFTNKTFGAEALYISVCEVVLGQGAAIYIPRPVDTARLWTAPPRGGPLLLSGPAPSFYWQFPKLPSRI